MFFLFFFFNDTATTEIYTLSLHDALPISLMSLNLFGPGELREQTLCHQTPAAKSLTRLGSVSTDLASIQLLDRKSTRLNSSHSQISYAVFCLKKKKKKTKKQYIN